ncbi:MAG: sugar ABC transporter ATP-binding protein [Actinobacteria bacterium]|nr:sugar ABC transporter ATP-binding protein [Actinomycetota bacterium]
MSQGAGGQHVSLLEVRGATKHFGAVLALDRVDLRLEAGEVLALLGDNGAGKSTLIKALSGVHKLDAGQIVLAGEEVVIKSPAEARAAGIETVYQDLALFDNLSATENFFAGREMSKFNWLRGFAFVRDRQMEREATNLLDSLEVKLRIDKRSAVGLMSGGQRQAVAVARAAAFASRIVILDEPTAALGVRETRNVLELIKKLAGRGIGVILISHNLEDVTAVADRAMVLRQGKFIGEAEATGANHEALVGMIVGASRYAVAGRSGTAPQ